MRLKTSLSFITCCLLVFATAQYEDLPLSEIYKKLNQIDKIGNQVQGLVNKTLPYQLGSPSLDPHIGRTQICTAAFIQYDILVKEGCNVVDDARRILAAARIATSDKYEVINQIHEAVIFFKFLIKRSMICFNWGTDLSVTNSARCLEEKDWLPDPA